VRARALLPEDLLDEGLIDGDEFKKKREALLREL
jgi:hypothetical protein